MNTLTYNMAMGRITEAAKPELRVAHGKGLSRVSSLANFNLLRYWNVYNL